MNTSAGKVFMDGWNTSDHDGAGRAIYMEGFRPDAPGFVSTVTLVETVRVLAHAYKTPRAAIANIVEGLLRSRELVVQDIETHYLALGVYVASTADYADLVIAQAGERAGCEATVTFDRTAAASDAMQLLETGTDEPRA